MLKNNDFDTLLKKLIQKDTSMQRLFEQQTTILENINVTLAQIEKDIFSKGEDGDKNALPEPEKFLASPIALWGLLHDGRYNVGIGSLEPSSFGGNRFSVSIYDTVSHHTFAGVGETFSEALINTGLFHY